MYNERIADHNRPEAARAYSMSRDAASAIGRRQRHQKQQQQQLQQQQQAAAAAGSSNMPHARNFSSQNGYGMTPFYQVTGITR